MALAASFLSIETRGDEKCLLCQKHIIPNEKTRCIISGEAWESFKEVTRDWSNLKIDTKDQLYHFTQVIKHLEGKEESFGKVHNNCRIKFKTRIQRYRKKYGERSDEETPIPSSVGDIGNAECSKDPGTRKSNRNTILKGLCFICHEKRSIDSNACNEGGIARCETDSACHRLNEKTALYLQDNKHKFYEAAHRFEILGSGQSFDDFATDIYYHKSCYISYALKQHTSDSVNQIKCEKEADVMDEFYRNIRIKIIRDKEAHLLHNLLAYIKDLSESSGIHPVVEHTSTLKAHLHKKFDGLIDFFPISKYVIVHASNMNPCQYSVSTLLGQGLRDRDYICSYSNFIRSKVNQAEFPELPSDPDEMIESFDNGPMAELYNTIYSTKYGTNFKTNEYGYAVTPSANIANKIWSIASDWQSLISNKDTPKQAMLSLILHRVTGSRGSVNYIHKLGHGIPYNKVCKINDTWSRSALMLHEPFIKGIPVHSTIDNNDGRQDTVTGSGTTHHTNCTLFQPILKGEEIGNVHNKVNIDDGDKYFNVPEYTIAKSARVGPPAFKNVTEDESTNLLDQCLAKDIAWSMANGLPSNTDEELPLLGSWTAFQRLVSPAIQRKSIIEYLPVIGQPPKYDVCKKYLDGLKEIIRDLELDYIFCHADEDVYAKLMHIIWKHGNLYKTVLMIMGGFHQMRVRQRIISKRHAVMGYKEWFVDSGIISPGSVDHAFNGGHYYRCMRLLKEAFDALIQFRTENITNHYQDIEDSLLDALKDLRVNPSPETVQLVVLNDSFTSFVSTILSVKGYQDGMVVSFLRDVSSLLALVSSVREGDIERHLQSERYMIKQVFAFDHQNYSRYLTYQHILLNDLKGSNAPAFQNLKDRGFGASYSNSNFSAVHGDLVTEYYNRETKVNNGPFRMGFSTSLTITNKWVRNIHIHAKLRMAMREKLNIKVSSTHKEVTDSGKKRHQKHVLSLKKKLCDYKGDLFSSGPAKEITTGAEIDERIVKGLITAPEIGDKRYHEFVKHRLVERSVSFFAPIKRLNIDTGVKKKKKPPRAISILKEDKQAFGLLCAKAVSLEEAFNFPITSIPLSLAYPEGSLRQSDKSSFRNWLIDETPSSRLNTAPTDARWIFDGMALFRSVKCARTYREYFINVLRTAVPPAGARPIQIEIVNDQYFDVSTKDDTRLSRGEGVVSRRVRISSVDQHMPQGDQWQQFFNNGQNKEDLIALAVSFFKSDEGRKLLHHPLVINSKEETWKITRDTVEPLQRCNHEEADYRIVYHASRTQSKSIIVAKDTDVLILLLYGMSQMPEEAEWYMKIDSSEFVKVNDIYHQFGYDIVSILPQFHAITGCDTTSYKYLTGKLKVFKKILKYPESLEMIQPLGQLENLAEEDIGMITKFIQTIIYSGTQKETLVDTRIRLYKKLKNKTSASIPADPDSTFQEVKRVHLQSFIWLRCLEPIIPMLDITRFGWTINNESEVKPVWFTGHQFPPSLRRSPPKRKGRSSKLVANPSDADEESNAENNVPRKGKKRKCDDVIIIENPSDADNESIENNEVEESMNTEESDSEEYSFEFESDFSTLDSSDGDSDSDYVP